MQIFADYSKKRTPQNMLPFPVIFSSNDRQVDKHITWTVSVFAKPHIRNCEATLPYLDTLLFPWSAAVH